MHIMCTVYARGHCSATLQDMYVLLARPTFPTLNLLHVIVLQKLGSYSQRRSAIQAYNYGMHTCLYMHKRMYVRSTGSNLRTRWLKEQLAHFISSYIRSTRDLAASHTKKLCLNYCCKPYLSQLSCPKNPGGTVTWIYVRIYDLDAIFSVSTTYFIWKIGPLSIERMYFPGVN